MDMVLVSIGGGGGRRRRRTGCASHPLLLPHFDNNSSTNNHSYSPPPTDQTTHPFLPPPPSSSIADAGRRVFELFRSKGLTAVIHDDLIVRVLLLGSIVVGLLTCGLGVILSQLFSDWYTGVDNIDAILAAGGFVIGLFVCDVMMSVVSSVVAAVLVCFVEDPAALRNTHPDYHEYLLIAWQQRFPEKRFV